MTDIPTIRIVIAGDLGTGKSSLVNMYIRAIFTDFDPTIEDTHSKRVTINDIVYNIEIVDTVDNEFRNENDRTSLYLNCDVIILTYAIDDISSFTNLIMRYSNLPINEEDGNKKLTYIDGRVKILPPIILAGTKLDLESSRQVAYQQGKKLQTQLQLQEFIECSALTKLNVDELFDIAIKFGLQHQQSENDLTHIYAADDGSSELNKTPSSNSAISKRNRDIKLKNLSLIPSIVENETRVDQNKDVPNNTTTTKTTATSTTINNNNDMITKAQSNRSKENGKGNLSPSLGTNNRTFAKATNPKPNNSTNGSNGCCIIM